MRRCWLSIENYLRITKADWTFPRKFRMPRSGAREDRSTAATYSFLSSYRRHPKKNGEGGIRTRGRGLFPYDGLANRCLQPLGHLSGQHRRNLLCANRDCKKITAIPHIFTDNTASQSSKSKPHRAPDQQKKGTFRELIFAHVPVLVERRTHCRRITGVCPVPQSLQ